MNIIVYLGLLGGFVINTFHLIWLGGRLRALQAEVLELQRRSL